MFLLFLTGCTTMDANIKIVDSFSKRAPKNPGCDLKLFIKEKPPIDYDVIAEVDGHMKRSMFLGGVTLEDQGFSEIRKAACKLGADAFIVTDFIQLSVSEDSHIHVWGQAIALQK